MTEATEQKRGMNTKTARILIILGIFGIAVIVLKYGFHLSLIPN